MSLLQLHAPTRREMLLGSGALFAWAYLPKAGARGGPRSAPAGHRAARRARRSRRGGAGRRSRLGRLRGDKALVLDGKPPALPLDSFFALNPAMPNLHRLYKAGAATIVHAAATPYRERSHFDGQDVLESGFSSRAPPTAAGSIARSARCSRATRRLARARAFAVGPIAPLVVRGPAPVLSWTPQRLPPASDDTLMRLLDLYRHTDPRSRACSRAHGAGRPWRAPAAWTASSRARPAPDSVRAYFAESAGAAAKFLARPDGPRIGALAFDGWDTHANEGAPTGGSRRCWARSTAPSPRSRPT